ncbi:MAG TPA: hypothetical protein VGO58_06055 [Chitinophagaceae bacterium]|nr:hypothetical protein [Chitinophagaceae bacterium]
MDLWLTFESGHGLYYYFKAEYVNYKDSIHFDKISHHDHEFAKEHCMRIDPERYRNVAFGNKLYDLLGQQFTADLLPRLHNLSVTITGGLPSPVRMLSRLLTLLIPLGIIIPFLVSLQLLPVWCTVLSISGTIALLIHLMLTLHQTLSGEIKM